MVMFHKMPDIICFCLVTCCFPLYNFIAHFIWSLLMMVVWLCECRGSSLSFVQIYHTTHTHTHRTTEKCESFMEIVQILHLLTQHHFNCFLAVSIWILNLLAPNAKYFFTQFIIFKCLDCCIKSVAVFI